MALEESGADAWIVASSTDSHVDLAERILATGVPVLVEKPLASSLAEARRLGPLVDEDSRNLMMGHVVLFNSEFRRLKAELAGRPPLAFVSCVRHRPSTTPDLYPEESPFHLLMVHDLYAVLALVGRKEPMEFTAQLRQNAVGVTDVALAQMKWDDGLLASFAASFLTPSGMPADGYDRMELYGDGWAARIDPNPRPLTMWDERCQAPMTLEIGADEHGASGMLAEELRCFCRVVRGQESVPVGATYADALQVIRWTDVLLRAAGEGAAP